MSEEDCAGEPADGSRDGRDRGWPSGPVQSKPAPPEDEGGRERDENEGQENSSSERQPD